MSIRLEHADPMPDNENYLILSAAQRTIRWVFGTGPKNNKENQKFAFIGQEFQRNNNHGLQLQNRIHIRADEMAPSSVVLFFFFLVCCYHASSIV